MIETYQNKIDRIKKTMYESGNIVCLLGIGVAMECGALNFSHEREAYRIEDIYHRSPDEIYSTGYYSSKKEMFFRFYKDEILSLRTQPNETFKALKEMENWGKLKCCITRNIYNLPQQAGIHNVVELHGNIYNNWCTRCGKNFPVDYMRAAKGVPMCDICGATIRPGVRVYGEMIRNDVMTKAANACQNADVIFVLGTNLYDSMVRNLLRHYSGTKIILISKNEHFTDNSANVVINGKVGDVLPEIVW